MQLFIGTSGYSYDDWKGRFYPQTMASREFLLFYAKHFNSVEINSTFYRTIFPNIVKSWYNKTPDDFRFSAKAPRYITHIQRLRTSPESLSKFFSSLSGLKEKLICILWQLPPSLKKDIGLLKSFLDLLNEGGYLSRYINAIEMRHKSWFNDKVYTIMEDFHSPLVWYDAPVEKYPKTPNISTGSVVYLRFHGTSQLYKGRYSNDQLRQWADKIRHQAGIRLIFAYFNNDYQADAVTDAMTFRQILAQVNLQ